MTYDVVVVGGGIGGLTTAALLAARGVGVCLVERESRAGGCASTVEYSGHSFETCAGLYAAWQPGDVHERVFDELPVAPPRVREVSPAYTVRLPGGEDVRVGGGPEEFDASLRASFPECAEAAFAFYREATEIADALVESIRKSGGTVRFDTTALRLAFDSKGRAAGVTLLSGETIEARRAVVSNLTVWDTYGKLVGADRTPAALRARLKNLRGWGAYQIFVSLDEDAARRLPSDQILALEDFQEGDKFDAERALFMFSAAPTWDARAPAGKRAAVVSSFTDAEAWFAFHTDESEHEEKDTRALEELWARVHSALPELGAGAEVIETSTPRTVYERTRSTRSTLARGRRRRLRPHRRRLRPRNDRRGCPARSVSARRRASASRRSGVGRAAARAAAPDVPIAAAVAAKEGVVPEAVRR